MCVEALLVVWSDLSERAREFDSRLWKSLWVTLIAIGFVLVFKAQLSGAKFNAHCGYAEALSCEKFYRGMYSFLHWKLFQLT